MKKIVLLVWLGSIAHPGFSQSLDSTQAPTYPSTAYRAYYKQGEIQLGIRFAPGIAFNTAEATGVSGDVTNNKTEIRLSGGLTADFLFTDTYAFSTGLWYTIKRSAFQNVTFADPNDPNGSGLKGTSEYNLQYLQVPVSLKLFTNEIASDARMYFQLGGTFDVKLAEKAQQKSTNALFARSEAQGGHVYKPIDVGLLLGLGVEFRLSEDNTLFGGISYNRGLVNVLSNDLKDDFGNALNDNLKSLNSLLSLEIGLKF